ncbi:MAG: sterol desaturase family protein [Geminicoccaceae bacterium]
MDIQTLLSVKTGGVLAALLLFGLWERVRPADPRPLLLRAGHAGRAAWQRLGRHAALVTVNAAAGPLIVLPVTWWAAGFDLGLRPAWSGWPLDILVLDLWIYAWHRANHEVPFLWRFHQVHHLDELLDTTSAFRFHVGEVVLSALVRALVVILFGMPMASVILFETIVLVCAIFHHSDAALPAWVERRLSRIIVTPGIHWVHHHALRRDTDSNYGTLFSFWDRIFGSRSATRRFSGMKLGVERMRERPLLRLLMAPFGSQGQANPAPRSDRQ